MSENPNSGGLPPAVKVLLAIAFLVVLFVVVIDVLELLQAI